MLQKFKQSKKSILQVLVPAVVIVLGIVTLSLSHAATSAASFEAESGTRTANAGLVPDSLASGSNYVRFHAAAVSGQCASGGSYLWANLAACGWPDASNTGPVLSQCGGSLTADSGSQSRTITISASNTTYNCKNTTGCLYITGTNVTISNVKITCNMGLKGTDANGKGAVYIEDGASATLTNVEINASKGVHACVWYQGTSMTATGLNCYNADDGIFSWADTGYSQTTGDNFTIKDSYFHDFTNTTSNGHIDGYQTEGAGNGLIDHNTYYMTSDDSNYTDSAIAIWNSLRSSHDITVQNNLFSGGGNTIYAEDYSPSESSNSGGYSTTNITFKNNRFSTIFGQCIGFGPGWDGAAWFHVGPTDGWRRTGNTVIETGENIDNNNPHFSNGSLCS